MIGQGVSAARALPITVREDAAPHACDAYVNAHPAASAYHRPAWLGVLGRAFGHPAKYLTAEADGRIVGVLPLMLFSSRLFGRFAVSIPFVNYGGIVADGSDATAALLQTAVIETARAGGTHLELRHMAPLCPGLEARRHKVVMRLPLERTTGQQWQGLDRKLRNQVRKAERSRLSVRIGGAELLRSFYAVFARNMRDLGTPVYSRRLFTEVMATFGDSARVFVVTLGDRPVAASIVHWHRDTIQVPWASAIRDYNPLCANVFLYWQMLQFASERGFRTFDFGRSTPGDGAFHFKRQWGAEPRGLVWEYWTSTGRPAPDLSPRNPRMARVITAWQCLPVPVASAIGPLIVRNIP